MSLVRCVYVCHRGVLWKDNIIHLPLQSFAIRNTKGRNGDVFFVYMHLRFHVVVVAVIVVFFFYGFCKVNLQF